MMKPCQCGDLFDAKGPQKFCSPKCKAAFGAHHHRIIAELSCETCSTVFQVTTSNRRRKFCSHICAMRHVHARNRKYSLQSCLHCNVVFSPKHALSLYCSRSCSGARRRTLPLIAACHNCERDFRPKDRWQKTCSIKCAGIAKRIDPFVKRANRLATSRRWRNSTPDYLREWSKRNRARKKELNKISAQRCKARDPDLWRAKHNEMGARWKERNLEKWLALKQRNNAKRQAIIEAARELGLSPKNIHPSACVSALRALGLI